jgi:glycosyltransferase involved in cell wall biosynthesis
VHCAFISWHENCFINAHHLFQTVPAPKLSLVIPAFNEERRLAATLSAVFAYLGRQTYSFEVIVSDDGSTDSTAAIAEDFARAHPELRVLRNEHHGKGYAVRAGIQAADGEIVLFSDADLSTPIEELDRFMPCFESGCEVVIGSRQGEGARRIGEPFFRHFMGRVFNWIVSLVTLSGIRDTQCGFKGFSARAARQIFRFTLLYTDNAPIIRDAMVTGFDVEVLFLARKLGYTIRELPVHWNYDAGTKVNPIKDSWRNFRDVLKVRINDRLGLYPVDTSAGAYSAEARRSARHLTGHPVA